MGDGPPDGIVVALAGSAGSSLARTLDASPAIHEVVEVGTTVDRSASARDPLRPVGADGRREVGCVVCVAGDGWRALLDALRERDPSLPFVLVYPSDDARLVGDALEAGVDDCVDPTAPRDLVVHRILRAARAGEDGADRPTVPSGDAERAPEDPFEPGSVRRALAATLDAVVLTDDEGTIRHVGPGSGGAFGYPSGELSGRAIGSLLGDVPPPTFDGRPIEERECDLVDAEGRTRIVLVSVRGVEAGGATRLYAVRDVTARRSRERRFEALLERSTDAMSVLDEAGVVTYGSPANERVFGHAPESLVGEPHLSVVHPDDAARVDETLSALLDDPEEATARIEYRGRHADGSWRWVESSVHVCEALPGGSLVVTSRDVTDRVERARRLEAAREARSFALQGAGAGIWEWEAGTGDLRLDESCERLFGLEPGGFDGRIETALEYVHPDDVAEMRADLERALGLEVDHVPRSTYRIVREDGVERWIESRAKLLTDDAGDPVRLLGVLVDITERQERLRQLRVLGRVLRHNLRNDLNVIRGHAELVASIGAAPATQCADRILRQSDRLLETADKEREITGVLATTLNREPIDLSPVVDRVVESARAEFPDARLSVDRPATATAVATDRIDALLGELVENALEHADRDPPTVDVRVTVGETSVEVRVADDGPGVPEMDREVVRGTGEVDPLFHGSGLGLWLVAWIGRRSGVTVRFEENDPRGTVVRVDVPRSGTTEDPDAAGDGGD